MKKKLLITLSLLSFAYQYSFIYIYWVKDELVNFNPMIANIYWITVGIVGISLGAYAFIKYRVNDVAFISCELTFLVGLLILGRFVIATFITSM